MDHPTRRSGPWLLRLTLVALALGLSACGVEPGPAPDPAPTLPAFTGISADANDHSVALRDLYVPDPGPAGYPAGGPAPLTLQVWNNTTAAISLIGATLHDKPLVLVGAGETASATFDVMVPGGANIPLSPAAGRYLQVGCLPAAVPLGSSLPIVFSFNNKKTITVDVPVGAFGVNGTPVVTGAPTATC